MSKVLHLMSVLFILKKSQNYSVPLKGNNTGLYNSAKFVSDMLNESGIISHISIVNDNNDIDREVTAHKPKVVIIEALWVVPSKFEVLTKLHPNVKWIIRLHSEIPFLSNEGIAMEWVDEYTDYKNVFVSCNSEDTMGDLGIYLNSPLNSNNNLIYLPNYYPTDFKHKPFKDNDFINIGCFGAIRPMKNQLIQVFASLDFAESIGKKLNFHINTGREEQSGNSVLKNIVSFFENVEDRGHILTQHEWSSHENFIELCSQMDIGIQMSLNETFNIVCADLISQGVPIVTSNEIPWSSKLFTANPTSRKEIVKMLKSTYYLPQLNVLLNQLNLKNYSKETKKIWLQLLS